MSENDISVNIVENPPIKIKITDEQQKIDITMDSNVALGIASHDSNQNSHSSIIQTINQSISDFVDEFRTKDILLDNKIDLKLNSNIFNTFSSLIDSKVLNLENTTLTSNNLIEGENVTLQKNGSDVTINVGSKNTLNIFSPNSGNLNSNGNADLLLNASSQLLFKVGNGENLNYKPLVITNIKGESFTIENINSIDISSYADGNYNIFVSALVTSTTETSALATSAPALSALSINVTLYNNTIYRQKIIPSTPSNNDIWLDTSIEPLKVYKYTNSSWQEYLGVPIGKITLASGVITTVTQPKYNQNGYNVNIQTYTLIMCNEIILAGAMNTSPIEYTLSFLPNDGGIYELYIQGQCMSPNSAPLCIVSSDFMLRNIWIAAYTDGYTQEMTGILPVFTTNRKILAHMARSSAGYSLICYAYRKVG